MVGDTDRDGAYLMALSASKAFGHSSEPAHAFTGPIAEIGATRGLVAAADAVVEDREQHGLSMSRQRSAEPPVEFVPGEILATAKPGEAMGLSASDLVGGSKWPSQFWKSRVA